MKTFILTYYTYIAGALEMVNVTVSVPDNLKRSLDQRAEINWSEVARQAWREKLSKLELLDRITAGSKATEKDVEELSKLIKKGVAERHSKKE